MCDTRGWKECALPHVRMRREMALSRLSKRVVAKTHFYDTIFESRVTALLDTLNVERAHIVGQS